MKEFVKSFEYAFKGIAHTFIQERSLRFHIVFAAYMFSFLLIYDFFEVSKSDWIAIILSTVLVISAEIMNTAVENAVDLATNEINPFAKMAKDASAGAVLVCAIGAVIVGVIVLWQPEAFEKMFAYYKEHIYMLFVLLISLVVSYFFIFKIFKKSK